MVGVYNAEAVLAGVDHSSDDVANLRHGAVLFDTEWTWAAGYATRWKVVGNQSIHTA